MENNIIVDFTPKQSNIILRMEPMYVNIRLNVLYDIINQVFVMEDGITEFVDETGENEFKPER